MFNEPMRVETVRSGGDGLWTVGLVGIKSERFRKVSLTAQDLEKINILGTIFTYDSDSRLLRLGLQAYARMLAAVTLHPGTQGRNYRLPAERDYQAVWNAQKRVKVILDEWEKDGGKGPCPIPNEEFHAIRPSPNARGLTAVTRYGINRFGQLYLARQLVALLEFAKQAALAKKSSTLCALTLSRVADYCSSQSRWDTSQERNVNSFGRQALPMLWDFAQIVPFRHTVGS